MNAIVRTNCPRDCYDACGMLVEVRAQGRHRVLGDPAHPVARGKLCSKCALAYNGVWQDPAQRLLHPLVRSGPRGGGSSRPSAGMPLAQVAERLNAVRAAHGGAPSCIRITRAPSLIAYLFPNRLFRHLGAASRSGHHLQRGGHVAWTLLFGNSVIGFDPRTAADSACILVWGANPSHSAPHAHEHWLREAPGKVIVVDPIRTESAAAADLHLQPRPGTDAALAFGLLHCLERDGRLDQDYIATHTLGYEEVLPDIRRATPQWTAAQTGVAVADIEQAATWYGAGPALLWCGQGLQRQASGGNIMRAAGLLPALTGNVGKPGAGFSYLNVAPILAGVDLDWLGGGGLGAGATKKVSHMELARRLEASDEFKAFFSWNTNPLASAPEQARLRRALQREDLFVVVSDLFMTDTARYADIVLPAEFPRVRRSHVQLFPPPHGRRARSANRSARPPNAEIFRRLGAPWASRKPRCSSPMPTS